MFKLRRAILILVVGILLIGNMALYSQKDVSAATLKNPQRGTDGVVTWDCVYFGKYIQSIVDGKKKEPIKWRVLSKNGNDLFLMADRSLDVWQYNCTNNAVTWETSGLRKWLNSDFLNKAFSKEEQKAIKTTKVTNNPQKLKNGGKDTNDKVYIPSIEEMINSKYGFDKGETNLDDAREIMITKFVSCGGSLKKSHLGSEGTFGSYWLRIIGEKTIQAPIVSEQGKVNKNQYGRYVSSDNISVCPVLHLNITNTKVWKYAGTVSSDTTSMSAELLEQIEKENLLKKTYKISVKKLKKKLKVSWTREVKANGYQIEYSTSGKFKNKKVLNINENKKKSITIKRLKSNKKYYVRQRIYIIDIYKTKPNKKYYGKWSKTKVVKVK